MRSMKYRYSSTSNDLTLFEIVLRILSDCCFESKRDNFDAGLDVMLKFNL